MIDHKFTPRLVQVVQTETRARATSIWVGALARCRVLGESLLPAPVPQSTRTIRFQRPPVTPDTEISTIRRCLSSQWKV